MQKRSGKLEEFDMSKLEASITKAGATEEEATIIAATVARNVTEGTDTAQLMKWAAARLRRIDPEAAERYETYAASAYSSCPRCGRSMDTDLRLNTSTCTGCGTIVQLPSKSTPVPAFQRTYSSTQQYSVCMRCGAQIEGDAKLCESCTISRPDQILTI